MSDSVKTEGPNFASDEALLPAIAQDFATGQVLMLAYMNRTAWEQTVATGNAVYYSRSRKKKLFFGEKQILFFFFETLFFLLPFFF